MRTPARDQSLKSQSCARNARRLRIFRRGTALLGFIVASGIGPAFAGDAATAKKAFQEGVQLFQRGDFQGARAMFLHADGEKHFPAITYNLGRVEEQLGRMQAAVDAYEAYVIEVGETGEFAQPATIAILQIKKRATRLRIETTPAGSRVALDGASLKEPTPTSVLIASGTHHLVVEWTLGSSHWSQERDIVANAPGTTITENFQAPEQPKDVKKDLPPEEPPQPKDLVVGAGVEVLPYFFFRNASTPTAERIEKPAAGVFAGVQAHFGYAINPNFEVLVRGFAFVGSEGAPAAYGWGIGPALSFRAAKPLWLGVGLIGGRAYTCRGRCPSDNQIQPEGKEWRTDLVFGAQFDVSYVVFSRPYGEWYVSVSPGMFFANAPPFGDGGDNHLLFMPFGFGMRSF